MKKGSKKPKRGQKRAKKGPKKGQKRAKKGQKKGQKRAKKGPNKGRVNKKPQKRPSLHQVEWLPMMDPELDQLYEIFF